MFFFLFFTVICQALATLFLCVIEGSCANVSFNSELERLSWRIVCLYGVKRRFLRLQKSCTSKIDFFFQLESEALDPLVM